MNQAFKKNLLQALTKCPAEEASLQSELICPGQVPEPAYTPDNNINKYEEQAYVKWYYKWIKMHNYQIFEMPVLPEKQHCAY